MTVELFGDPVPCNFHALTGECVGCDGNGLITPARAAENARTLVRTEDRAVLRKGGRAFNYYDGKWGTIGDDLDRDGWFTFRHDDGTSAVLNGERIATYNPKDRK
jgi:hypothetical protein